jgi:DNA-binding transcriptional LysR family regulator
LPIAAAPRSGVGYWPIWDWHNIERTEIISKRSIEILDMSGIGTPTLDQLHVLVAVADTGSFSAAARRLNRAQSVVSYTIANLEQQLGLALFEREGRRPALTEAGRALVADARRVGLLVDELKARASALRQGLEAELGLAVDVVFPTARLVSALEDFAREFPTVMLRLRIEALGGVAELVQRGVCRIGVIGPLGDRCENLERRAIGTVRLVPVAAPGHTLAVAPRPIPRAMVREHLQLVLTDRTALTEGRDFGVFALRTWRLGDLGAKRALLLAGLGWGNMPEEMVADDLAAGRLVRLALAEGAQHHFSISLVHRLDAPPGPAGRWLSARLEAHMSQASSST